MAQEYTVEQLNHGRKVYDFMRWDYWAFGISGLLLIAAIVIMACAALTGADFTGGTVIEITLEKPAEIDVMRDALQKPVLKSQCCKTLVAATTSWSVCRLLKAKPAVRCWAAGF